MSAACFCGDWFVFSCGTRLVAVHGTQSREPFVFDCSAAEKRPSNAKSENNGDGGGGAAEETGSDAVLALAASPSGKLVALTDDNKRLVLLQCEPAWRCVSTRFVVRRCTALQFTRAEDELLAADKSGDVYSFSVTEPRAEGELKMGHLSMLLAVTTSPDDRFIITADRDEKIRVSHRRSPYNIQSFCLGHQQFVSALLVPPAHPHWLLSGSGDGTMKLWEYESGRKLQSCDLSDLQDSPEADDQKNATVSRIVSSPDARLVAVQCERVSALQFFSVKPDGEEKLTPHSRLSLPHPPLDVTFDPEGRLWVLMQSGDAPLQIYTHRGDGWCAAESAALSRATAAVRRHGEALQDSARSGGRFEHLQKVSFDNVAVYLQKKQQRLEEQQLKRTKTPVAGGNKRSKREAMAP